MNPALRHKILLVLLFLLGAAKLNAQVYPVAVAVAGWGPAAAAHWDPPVSARWDLPQAARSGRRQEERWDRRVWRRPHLRAAARRP